MTFTGKPSKSVKKKNNNVSNRNFRASIEEVRDYSWLRTKSVTNLCDVLVNTPRCICNAIDSITRILCRVRINGNCIKTRMYVAYC